MAGWIILFAAVCILFAATQFVFLPKIVTTLRYGAVKPRGRGRRIIKEVKGESIVYDAAPDVSHVIPQYLLSERNGEKLLVCKLDESVRSVDYDVALFDKNGKVFKVLNVREEVGRAGYAREIALPRKTEYVSLYLNAADSVRRGVGAPSDRVCSIEVSGAQRTFEKGDAFSPGGNFKVTALLGDGKERILTEEEYIVDSSLFDSSKEGKCEITVRYAEDANISARYTVTIERATLRILSIGNSYSEDAHEFLYNIAEALSDYDEIVTGNLMIGGCSLDTHYFNIENNVADYSYRKQTAQGVTTQEGYTVLAALMEEDWDFVTIQQVSHFSGIANTISAEKLGYIRSFIVQNCSNGLVKFAWHSTWAYQQDCSYDGFGYYNYDQQAMYEAIINVARTVIGPSGLFDVVIPSGTAVQNARTGYVGDTLTRDGFHLTLDRGRFIAALTFYKALAGKSIEGAAEADSLAMAGGSQTYADALDEKFKALAVESVNNACEEPYSVTRSKYTE